VRAKIIWLKLIERSHPQPPGAVTSYRCAEHEIRSAFYLFYRRTAAREHVWPLSRQGCTAYKWLVHMRDRSRTGRCLEWPRRAEPEREPNLPDFLDMWGQPGQK
jgi:hypothetical protein